MTSQTPAQLSAGPGLLTVLRRILIAAEPEEGCALVLGNRVGKAWHLGRIWPCCNVWPRSQERHHRFAIDPREQLVAQKWGRLQGLEVLGSAHSHPLSEAVPSSTDRHLCAVPALMVILGRGSPSLGRAPDLRRELVGWWIPEAPAPPQRLPWRMEI